MPTKVKIENESLPELEGQSPSSLQGRTGTGLLQDASHFAWIPFVFSVLSTLAGCMPTRVNDELRSKLLAMRTEDRRVRQELLESGELGGAYVPRMEEVHRKNAAGLRQLIVHYGWPTEDIAGQRRRGSRMAHRSAFDRRAGFPAARIGITTCVYHPESRTSLACRISRGSHCNSRRSVYNVMTQWFQDAADGKFRPLFLADAEHVDALPSQVGLGPIARIPEMGPALPSEKREEIERNNRWWEDWYIQKGWRD